MMEIHKITGRTKGMVKTGLFLIGILCTMGFLCHSGDESIRKNTTMDRIVLRKDSSSFIYENSGKRFLVWGFNYDRDDAGRLIEDYWNQEWDTVVEDFQEMKQLGANVVRIHLQVGKFLLSPTEANPVSLKQLARLVELAENTGLYLDITGLGNYRRQDVPAWFHQLDEADRWKAQATFWKAISKVCSHSPAIYFYDLMNEPLWPSTKKDTSWLSGELGGFYYCQRITLGLGERDAKQVAKEWIDNLVAAIRSEDRHHLITLGVIPWALVFPGAGLSFYSKDVGNKLDFVSVHFYPKGGNISKQMKALKTYDIEKPLVIEEMFPLNCSLDELNTFIDSSRKIADGWIGFYWGKRLDEYTKDDFAGKIMRGWLEYFQTKASDILQQTSNDSSETEIK